MVWYGKGNMIREARTKKHRRLQRAAAARLQRRWRRGAAREGACVAES